MSATTLNLTIVTVGVVGVGKLAKGEELEFKMVAAAGITAIGLSMLENLDEQLAKLFAGAILLTASFYYIPAITDKLGYTGGASGAKNDGAGKGTFNKERVIAQ